MSMVDNIANRARERASEGDGEKVSDDNEGESRDSYADEPRDNYSKTIKSSFDDLARILNVSKDDRSDFDSALEDAIEAICERADKED